MVNIGFRCKMALHVLLVAVAFEFSATESGFAGRKTICCILVFPGCIDAGGWAF